MSNTILNLSAYACVLSDTFSLLEDIRPYQWFPVGFFALREGDTFITAISVQKSLNVCFTSGFVNFDAGRSKKAKEKRDF